MNGSENALVKVERAVQRGALLFVNRENFQANTELFRTEVTELQFTEEDFHRIGGKLMPKSHAVDRIGEANEITFTERCEVVESVIEDDMCGRRTVYIGKAQGKRRAPDGSWQVSCICEYEFDPVLRALMDKNVLKLTEQTEKLVGRQIMAYRNMGRQRANTGARLRVIRQLVAMPTAFEGKDALRPLCFARIVQNTDYILRTAEGRALATAQALNLDMATLYGHATLSTPARDVVQESLVTEPALPVAEVVDTASALPMTEVLEAGEADEPALAERTAPRPAAVEPDFVAPQPQAASTEFDQLTSALEDYLYGYTEELNVTTTAGMNPYALGEAELANPHANIFTRKAMLGRIKAFLEKKGVQV